MAAYFTNTVGGQITSGPPALTQYFSPASSSPFGPTKPTIFYNGLPNGYTIPVIGTLAPTSNIGVLTSKYNISSPFDNYLNFNTSLNLDWTISNLFCECWVYSQFASILNAQVPIFSAYDLATGTRHFDFGVYTSSGATYVPSVLIGSQILSAPQNIRGPGGIATWHHLAFSIRPDTSNIYLYVDGTITSYPAISTTYLPTANIYLGFTNKTGVTGYSSSMLYYQDLRIIKGGQIPTTNFTPSQEPWPLRSVPSYVPGGTNILGLAAQYLQQVSFRSQ
jgi:hypothetical protein